jgi:predicted DNA-binding transcriptional regulator AlpA
MAKNNHTEPDKNNEPQYIRLKDASQLFSISVSKLHQLIADGRLRTINLRAPHQQRGIRLIARDTLSAFLEQHAEGGEKTE